MTTKEALAKVSGFIGRQQLIAMLYGVQGEEGQFFRDKFEEVARTIETMPKTYEQDGLGEKAIFHLHYLAGGCDWYITERDMEPEQHQAFGWADMGDGGEFGYISLVELVASPLVQLDLYFTPKPLCEILKKVAACL